MGPLIVDLRPWCSPIEDQGQIGSCTAQAVVGALEFFERKTRGVHVDASRLFLYKVTRRYLQWEGDTGAFVRSAIKALRLFGAPPERYWPYDEARFDEEPDAFLYAYGQSFKAIEYFRLEGGPSQLRSALTSGLPFAFGFSVFSSMFSDEVERTGVVPYPRWQDSLEGGHAVLAVGYTATHLLFRNSWGRTWGDKGYGYLPWAYFDSARPLADDFWALTNASWIPDDPKDLEVMGHMAMAEAVARKGRKGKKAAHVAVPPDAPAIIRVSHGVRPERLGPLRLTSEGVSAADAPIALPSSASPMRLTLTALRLDANFDTAFFNRPVNEMYVLAVAWDLSGSPPRVIPDASLTPEVVGQAAYLLRQGDGVQFLGDGLELWPSQIVVGSLNVRIFVLEGDADVRQTGETLKAASELVGGSTLTTLLTALVAGPSAPLVLAIQQAGAAIGNLIGTALSKNKDDLCAVFDGSWGVEHGGWGTQEESHDQNGVGISLALRA